MWRPPGPRLAPRLVRALSTAATAGSDCRYCGLRLPLLRVLLPPLPPLPVSFLLLLLLLLLFLLLPLLQQWFQGWSQGWLDVQFNSGSEGLVMCLVCHAGKAWGASLRIRPLTLLVPPPPPPLLALRAVKAASAAAKRRWSLGAKTARPSGGSRDGATAHSTRNARDTHNIAKRVLKTLFTRPKHTAGTAARLSGVGAHIARLVLGVVGVVTPAVTSTVAPACAKRPNVTLRCRPQAVEHHRRRGYASVVSCSKHHAALPG